MKKTKSNKVKFEKSHKKADMSLTARQKLFWNPDPVKCFINLLEIGTKELGAVAPFDCYFDMFKKLEFDKLLNIDLDANENIFRTYFVGFRDSVMD